MIETTGRSVSVPAFQGLKTWLDGEIGPWAPVKTKRSQAAYFLYSESRDTLALLLKLFSVVLDTIYRQVFSAFSRICGDCFKRQKSSQDLETWEISENRVVEINQHKALFTIFIGILEKKQGDILQCPVLFKNPKIISLGQVGLCNGPKENSSGCSNCIKPGANLINRFTQHITAVAGARFWSVVLFCISPHFPLCSIH